MRLGVLSDVHANLPALEAVLADIDAQPLEELWCLGDVVGYGAHPNECCALVAERCNRSLVGNHDLAVLDALDLEAFSPTAARAARWTQRHVSEESLEFLRGLQPADEAGEIAIYHASPRDPVWEYVLWEDQAAECIEAQASRLSLIGHSHVALAFVDPGREPQGSPPQVRRSLGSAGTRLDLEAGRWLINPGSVGQPRDRDPRAAWLELDTGACTATFHRVRYDIDRAAEAIEATDLPAHLGRRLYVGQ
jgi:diadenosine tetraphosphatase ApaH/serine/threonine PP2A family protein phosphatase